jgi:hypothetical protein
MADLAGDIRKQVSVDATGGNPKQTGAGKSTPQSSAANSPLQTPDQQGQTGDK